MNTIKNVRWNLDDENRWSLRIQAIACLGAAFGAWAMVLGFMLAI